MSNAGLLRAGERGGQFSTFGVAGETNSERLLRVRCLGTALVLLSEDYNKAVPRHRTPRRRLFVQPWMHPRHVRNPKHLPVDLHTAQAVLWQVLLFQAKKCEVR